MAKAKENKPAEPSANPSTPETPAKKEYVLNSALPEGFKVKRTISAQVWKWADGDTKYARIETKMTLSKMKQQVEKGKTREPATICTATNLAVADSKPQTLIVGTVLRDLFNESFPNDGYIGKCFAMTRYQVDGKRYKSFRVEEIETA